MKDIETLKAILEAHKEELKERYHVKELGIFGSYVRGEAGEGSDIDILVEFEVVPGLLKFIELEEHLSELLGVKVDLVRKKSVREELKESILGEVVMI
jgi:predicted nucleotidyltransferase